MRVLVIVRALFRFFNIPTRQISILFHFIGFYNGVVVNSIETNETANNNTNDISNNGSSNVVDYSGDGLGKLYLVY